MSQTNKVDNIDVEVHQAQVAKKRKVITIVSLCVAVVILLVVIVVLVVVFTGKNDEQPAAQTNKKYEMCESDNCKALAKEIAKSMDKSFDPCKNFYSYACAGWEKANPLNGKGSLTTMGIMADENIIAVNKALEKAAVKYSQNEAVMKTARFYNSCLNTSRIKLQDLTPMENLIAEYGGWTVSDNYNSSVSIATRIGKAARDLNVNTLIGVKAEQDVFDSKSVILTLLYAGVSKSSGEKAEPYKKYMKEAGKLFAGSNTDAKMLAIYDFETKLHALGDGQAAGGGYVMLPKRAKRMKRSSYQDDRTTISQFCVDTGFSCSLLKEVLGIIYGRSFTGSEKLSSPDKLYFEGLYKLYNSTQESLVADYIMWRVVDHYITALNESHAEPKEVFEQIPISPRWKTCVNAMMKGFVLTIGLLYIDQANFDDQSKKAVESMTNDVRNAFIEGLPSQTWMDSETQKKAKEKALAIGLDIGYPTMIKDPVKLKEEYKSMNITDDYFANCIAMNHYMRMTNIRTYGKPVDKSVWDGGNPAEVNGIYDSFKNSIVYLAGIIQPPLYNKDYPRYMNYGAIGTVIGHELTHGFDGQGRRYDKNGEFVNWWSNSAATSFEDKTSCLVKQYDQYTMYNTHINGTLTLDENIADNGGVKIAYDAYKSWAAQNGTEKILPDLDLNPDQLFFLGFAQIWCSAYTEDDAKHQLATDSHTIGKYRVIGSLSNFDKFSEAFQCSAQSTMNPTSKCAVW